MPHKTAVKLHPEYGFAMFNPGVSLVINRNLIGAVFALERSLALEPWNTKMMVFLGKASTESRIVLTWSSDSYVQVGRGVELMNRACSRK